MLTDPHGRRVDYLRVSVTDRCNLRCQYCMPPEGIDLLRREEILSYEEIWKLVTIAVSCGVRRVRITGGEPLVRRNLPELISNLSRIHSLDEVSLTTNGVLLGQLAQELKSSGLQRVNISLDSLKREKFAEITARDELPSVLLGIDRALDFGLHPVKLNVVVRRGMNDDELLSFARLSQTRPLQIRFIEYMGFGSPDWEVSFFPVSQMKEKVSVLGSLQPVEAVDGNGPARYFRYENSLGTIGFISPISEGFCRACNRLRLSSDGKLRPCLLSPSEIDLGRPLRNGAPAHEIEQLFRRAVRSKPLPPSLREMVQNRAPHMCSIGG